MTNSRYLRAGLLVFLGACAASMEEGDPGQEMNGQIICEDRDAGCDSIFADSGPRVDAASDTGAAEDASDASGADAAFDGGIAEDAGIPDAALDSGNPDAAADCGLGDASFDAGQ
ncbi:MAG: hypothetical protein H6715_05650 [Myxococcales bacterium]|nr:hypothetical protein [Myxococcales bacterium]MCB9707915.1 hypothetical protein [Myxococcales bacterium]